MSKKSEATKLRVLEAAAVEFSLAGYANGSTNNIAKNAGVSKGVIFHYYSNKKNLYIACLEHAFRLFDHYLFDNLKIYEITDLFERIFYIGNLKRNFYSEYSNLFPLIVEASRLPKSEDNMVIIEMAEKYIQAAYDKFYLNIDLSNFKQMYQNRETLHFVVSLLAQYFANIDERYSNLSDSIKNYDIIIKEIVKFTDIIKHGIFSENVSMSQL